MPEKEALARGFAFDELTEADNKSVESNRHRMYSNPCGAGAWVSVKTGLVVRGHGGNEREQAYWASQAPWVKIEEDTDFRDSQRNANERYLELVNLKQEIAELIGAEL